MGSILLKAKGKYLSTKRVRKYEKEDLMGTFNFKAPVELWATMKDVARHEGISVSEMIRRAVGEWLVRHGRGAA
jgi:hypothetical protein